MIKVTRRELLTSGKLETAMSSGPALLVKKKANREIESQCLLINVTGLTPSAIEELAQASVKAVQAAKNES